jgi:hypothetical protein
MPQDADLSRVLADLPPELRRYVRDCSHSDDGLQVKVILKDRPRLNRRLAVALGRTFAARYGSHGPIVVGEGDARRGIAAYPPVAAAEGIPAPVEVPENVVSLMAFRAYRTPESTW